MRIVTFKIEEELLKKLDLYAVNNRVSRSEAIRKAIESFLTQFIVQENHNPITRTQEI